MKKVTVISIILLTVYSIKSDVINSPKGAYYCTKEAYDRIINKAEEGSALKAISQGECVPYNDGSKQNLIEINTKGYAADCSCKIRGTK